MKSEKATLTAIMLLVAAFLIGCGNEVADVPSREAVKQDVEKSVIPEIPAATGYSLGGPHSTDSKERFTYGINVFLPSDSVMIGQVTYKYSKQRGQWKFDSWQPRVQRKQP